MSRHCRNSSIISKLGCGGLLLAGLSRVSVAQEVSPTAALALEPCAVEGVAGEVKCGTLRVFENRTTRAGRRIGLKIIVLVATGTQRAPDPIFFIVGGPGEAATEEAAGVAAELASLRSRRDIVLVDQRGTGGSNPLNIDLFAPSENLQSYLGEFFPHLTICKARAILERSADLTQYTTPIAMDDLDDVRSALGYDRINLIGGSYGTRAALQYMRAHGDRVRTAVLQGVDPTGSRIPLTFPKDAQKALDGLFDECAADPDCHAAFPDPRDDLKKALKHLADKPVEVPVLNPKSGAVAKIKLLRDLAAEAIRYMQYSPLYARQIPALVHEAAKGNYAPLAEMALFGRTQIVSTGSIGMYLSVTCAEDLPWIAPGEGELAASGTFLGDYRLRQQRVACDCWAKGNVPADFLRPVASDAEVLLLTGALDPATPPYFAEQVAANLPNSLNVVIPHGGHGFDGLNNAECIERLVEQFVESGSGKALDTACVSTITRAPFVLTAADTAVVDLPAAQLARFAGHYTGDPAPISMNISPAGNRLKMVLSTEKQFLLAPVSATRFRLVGPPGAYVEFEMQDGAVTRVSLEESGAVQMTFVPKR